MTERTVFIKGPFTDAEIREIVAVVQKAEGKRPDETFKVLIGDDASTAGREEIQRLLADTMPLRPGYQRTWEVFGPGGEPAREPEL